jgi:hypothetical protein
MKGKLIKKDDHYFLEVDYWYPKYKQPAIIANTFVKPKGEVYDLSKQNCNEIFGVVDVEKLAYNHRRTYQDSFEGMNECIMKDAMHQQVGFIEGFNKAMELNKDKRFTEQNLREAYSRGILGGDSVVDRYIKALQPTEIEVEIEMIQKEPSHTNNGIFINFYTEPKLDSEGCLILKKN